MYSKETCFLCLESDKNIKNIAKQDEDDLTIENKLNYLLFELDDFKPKIDKNICANCLVDVNCFYKVKQKWMSSISTLSNYFDRQTDPKTIKIKEEIVDIEEDEIEKVELVEIKQEYGVESILETNRDPLLTEQTKTKRFIGKKYKCSECYKSFDLTNALTRHKRLHTGQQPFICKVCDKPFNHRSNLYKHTLLHTKVSSFNCNLCDKVFKVKSSLEKHIQIHLNGISYDCDTCDSKFQSRSDLRSHKLTHTVKQCHKCDICGMEYPLKSYLMNHLRSHKTETPYDCNLCLSKCVISNHIKKP